jgi:hypothetical protein
MQGSLAVIAAVLTILVRQACCRCRWHNATALAALALQPGMLPCYFRHAQFSFRQGLAKSSVSCMASYAKRRQISRSPPALTSAALRTRRQSRQSHPHLKFHPST